MRQDPIIDRLSKIALALLPLVTLVATPSFNFDAINLPRFAILTVGTCLIIGLATGLRRSSLFPSKIVEIITLVFLAIFVLNLVFNGMSSRQIFGSYGSNFGLITFTSLLVLFVVMSLEYEGSTYHKLLGGLVMCGTLNALYGVLQIVDFDPIDWVKPYGELVGTLGNPNFFSALLGISAVAALALAMGGVSHVLRSLLFILILLMISLVVLSDSIQGLFAASAGTLILLYSRFIAKSPSYSKIPFLMLTLTFGLLVIGGIFNKGPLSAIIYGNSIIARGFYWTAAIEMVKAQPLTGHGFDSFGELYRAYRSEKSTITFGPDLVANSAHSAPLDVAVYGGIPFLIALAALMFASLRSGLQMISKSKDFDAVGSGLIGCWVASVVQMLVSPMQIGVNVWFWALSGVLIGYQNLTTRSLGNPKLSSKSALPPQAILSGSVTLVIGVLLVVQPFSKDIHFQRAIFAQDAKQILIAATRWPQDSFYFNYASELFLASQLNIESLTLSRESVSVDPDNFVGWRLIYINPEVSQRDKTLALSEMGRLDPNFKP